MFQKRGVFGRPVKGGVPYFIEDALERIELNPKQGIFRISGSKEEMQKIKESVDGGERVKTENIPVDNLAGLVKMFLREHPNNPDSVFSKEILKNAEKILKDWEKKSFEGERNLLGQTITIKLEGKSKDDEDEDSEEKEEEGESSDDDDDELVTGKKYFLQQLNKLPKAIYQLHMAICRTCFVIQEEKEKTKMDANNLALVICPNFYPGEAVDNKVARLYEYMIDEFPYFFPEDGSVENRPLNAEEMKIKSRRIVKLLRRAKLALRTVQHDGNGWMMYGTKTMGKLQWKWKYVKCKLTSKAFCLYESELDSESPSKIVEVGDYFTTMEGTELGILEKVRKFVWAIVARDKIHYFSCANDLEVKRWLNYWDKAKKTINSKFREGELKKKGARLGKWKKRTYRFDLEKKVFSYKKGKDWQEDQDLKGIKYVEVNDKHLGFKLECILEEERSRSYRCVTQADYILWNHFFHAIAKYKKKNK